MSIDNLIFAWLVVMEIQGMGNKRLLPCVLNCGLSAAVVL